MVNWRSHDRGLFFIGSPNTRHRTVHWPILGNGHLDNCKTALNGKGNNKRLVNQKLIEVQQKYKKYLPSECSFETNEAEKIFEVYLEEWLEGYKHKI